MKEDRKEDRLKADYLIRPAVPTYIHLKGRCETDYPQS